MQELAERGFALAVALLLVGSGLWIATHERNQSESRGGSGGSAGGYIAWGDPVWLPRASECVDEDNHQLYPEYAIGYEPSLAVDAGPDLVLRD